LAELVDLSAFSGCRDQSSIRAQAQSVIVELGAGR